MKTETRNNILGVALIAPAVGCIAWGAYQNRALAIGLGCLGMAVAFVVGIVLLSANWE